MSLEEVLPATLSADASASEPRVAENRSEISQQPGGAQEDKNADAARMRSSDSTASKVSIGSTKTTVTILGDGDSPSAKTDAHDPASNARVSQMRGPRISAYPGRVTQEELHEKRSV